ncbi:MAG: hypothetical protein C4K60_00610 [Ideonella sp. MAG2]|nr:MAG: hypothetical protein C4K60_00610 [Ideonella sp. MAG2]
MDSPDDRLRGLSCGADAYLTKPIDSRELLLILARLRDREQARQAELAKLAPMAIPSTDAILGDNGLNEAEPPPSTPTGWTLCGASGLLRAPNGTARRISSNERALLMILGQAQGETMSAQTLAQAMNFGDGASHRHRIEVIISRLHRNVEQSTGMHLPLMSVRGSGYCVRDLLLAP